MTGARKRGLKRWTLRSGFLASSALSLMASSPACAQDVWHGTTDGNWFVNTNWADGSTPTASDDVVIDQVSPNAATIDTAGAVADQITIGNGHVASLTIHDSGTLTASSAQIGAGGGVTVSGGDAAWHVAGSVIDDGIIDLNDDAMLSADALTLADTAGSTGRLRIGTPTGTAADTAGTLNVSTITFGDGNGSIIFSHTSSGYSFGAAMSGAGSILHLAGETDFDGNSAGYTGTFAVDGGTAVIHNAMGGLSSVIDYTGAVVVTGADADWALTGRVYAGYTDEGSLTIADGGHASAGTAYVGYGSGSNGTASVSGAGSSWTLGASLYVGGTGNGALTIDNGGVVSDVTGYVGLASGSDSSVSLDGDGSAWRNSNSLFVGAGGNGTLQVDNGAALTSGIGYIGRDAGAYGAVTITGGGTWHASSDIYAGYQGTGRLTVSDGGIVTGSHGDIAAQADSNGTVLVTGDGSSWSSAQTLTIGGAGAGSLTIADGGAVSATGGTTIASASGSSGTLSFGGVAGDASAAAGTLDTPTIEFGDGDGRIVFNHTDNDFTLAAAISGAGEIDQLAGTTTLSGDSSGFTGTGNVVGGTLMLTGKLSGDAYIGALPGSDGAAVVSGDGAVWAARQFAVGWTGNGTLTIEDGGSVTTSAETGIAAMAGSSGSATVTGAGSSWHADSDFYVGYAGQGDLTIADGGAVDVANAALGFQSGSQGMALVSGDGSSWSSADMLAIGMDGAGALTIADGGTVSAGDGTVIASTSGSTGMLAIGGASGDDAAAAGTLDTPTIQFGDGDGQLVFNHTNDDFSLAAAISGDGRIDQLAGTTTLSGDSTGFTGTTNVAGGTLILTDQLGGDAYIGAIPGSTGAAVVSGDGAIWAAHQFAVGWTGDGTLSIEDGGSVTTSAETGIAAMAGSSGSATVTGTGSSWRTDGDFYVGYAGQGDLTVADSGTVGAGALIIANGADAQGTLNIGAAADDAAAAAGIIDAPTVTFGDGDGRLVFNHTAGDYAFAPDISGTGAIDQIAGTTILSGDSSGFDGATTVSGGTLVVNGVLGGTLDVMEGGILKGAGTVGDVTVAGIVSPGNSPGTLSAASMTFGAGSTYRVELNDGGSSAGVNNDLIAATGAVTINGGTVQVSPANGTDDGSSYTPDTRYTIITAGGGVTGTFDTIADDYPMLNFALSYDANDVYVTSSLAAFCRPGFTANQCATANAAETLGAGSLLGAIVRLGTDDAAGAMDALSGQIHAAVRTALIEDDRFVRDAVLHRLGAVLDHGNAPARTTLWAQGLGSWGHWSGNDNAMRLGRSIGGLLIGGDTHVSDAARIGFVGGYEDSHVNLADRMSFGSVKGFRVGAYGGGQWNGFGLRLGATYAWHDLDIDRTVAFTTLSNRLSASYNANTLQAFGEASYRIGNRTVRVEPYAGLAYVHLKTDGVTEQGGAAALAVDGDTMNTGYASLGLRAGAAIPMTGDLKGDLTAKLGWRHAFNDVTPMATMAFASGSDAFSIAGAPITRDAFTVDVGFDQPMSRNLVFGIGYSGQFGSGESDHGLKASLIARF